MRSAGPRRRLADLERRLREIEADSGRQASVQHDAAATITRLGTERQRSRAAATTAAGRRVGLGSPPAGYGRASWGQAEARLSPPRSRLPIFSHGATRCRPHGARPRSGPPGRPSSAKRWSATSPGLPSRWQGPSPDELRAALAQAEADMREAEEAASVVRAALAPAREEEARRRSAANEADRAASRLETELRTLAKLFGPSSGKWPLILDRVTAAPATRRRLRPRSATTSRPRPIRRRPCIGGRAATGPGIRRFRTVFRPSASM
jgi:chromosome segregation protein